MNVRPLLKDDMLVIRVTSAFKSTLQRVAKEEHRPVGNLVEHVLIEWLKQRGSDHEPRPRRKRARRGA